MIDARSYTKPNKFSDHKPVCARFRFHNRHLTFSKNTRSSPKYDCASLSSVPEVQIAYREALALKVQSSSSVLSDPEVNENDKMKELVNCLRAAASDTVGPKPKKLRDDYTHDKEIVEMTEERHQLITNLHMHNTSANRGPLRKRINFLKNQLKKRLKHLKELRAEELALQITSTDESRRMFEAVRELSKVSDKNNAKKQTVRVHDSDGNIVISDVAKVAALKEWFQEQFTDGKAPLDPFDGPARPLDTPITTAEVTKAAKTLKNGRATGPDGIQNELLKYGGEALHSTYSDIINRCFETNTHLDAVGEAVITPLQKPGKPKGPLKNIRPLTLSNAARKILSLIALRRIQRQVDNYTGPWQAGYKHGRSCSDLVWCQRMMIAIVMEKHWSFHRMGIDMSAAFDTIKRSTILNLLADAGCSDDDIRLVRFLLSNTKIRVRVNNTFSIVFETTLGSFQGDSLSGCLFTLVLAAALNHLRTLIPFRPITPIDPDTMMPLEKEYADDVNFLDEEKVRLEFVLPIATHVLKEWNLNVNASKTEFDHFYKALKDEVDEFGKPVKGNEPWRTTKLLGSQLCSRVDIERKCILGNIAFSKFKSVWLQGKRIDLSRLIQVYEAMVVSVMLYNSSSWSATKIFLDKLDVCHRRHLRAILNVKWPAVIKNKKLYEVCNTTPLSERVRLSRWRMLGHILRSPENSPASLALHYAVVGHKVQKIKGRRGAHEMNLLKVIRKDLEVTAVYDEDDKEYRLLSLKDGYDLNYLKDLARDRKKWKEAFYSRTVL